MGGRESSVPLSGVLPISPARHQRGVAPFGTSFNLPLGELGKHRRNQRSSRCSASSGLTSIICTPIFIGGSVGVSVGTTFFSSLRTERTSHNNSQKYGQQGAQHRYGNTGADFINIALF